MSSRKEGAVSSLPALLGMVSTGGQHCWGWSSTDGQHCWGWSVLLGMVSTDGGGQQFWSALLGMVSTGGQHWWRWSAGQHCWDQQFPTSWGSGQAGRPLCLPGRGDKGTPSPQRAAPCPSQLRDKPRIRQSSAPFLLLLTPKAAWRQHLGRLQDPSRVQNPAGAAEVTQR